MYALCGIEATVVAAAAIIAFFVRFPTEVAAQNLTEFWWVIPLSVGLRVALFWMFGLYGWVWYYMGVREVLDIAAAVSAGSVALAAVALAVTRLAFPETLLVVDWLIVMALVSGERLSIRLWREHNARHSSLVLSETKKRLLVVGAGDAAEIITREIGNRPSLGYQLVGYADDDSRKLGQTVHGVTVLGTTGDIPALVSKHNVNEIIIAIPSASGQSMRRIVEQCEQALVKFKTLPALHEIIDGQMTFSRIREVEVEDLLRREPYRPDLNGIGSYIKGSRILVTGAAGSIGSELCRQIATFDPALLIMFDIGENGLHELELEMNQQLPNLKMATVIGNVRSKEKADAMMDLYHPDIIFHAAAHKHVPMMEKNADEAVLNNILGTKVWIEAADRHGVKRFVFVSTDKAVNPTSVMGATKRVAGMMVQCKSRESATKFVVVRFGNVLGSNGSVVPLFKKQIARGGPVTVTHPDMVRYFMTIGEAARLIIQAGALGDGGEVFVLDMGQPVKIMDLARDMIKLSGLKEGEDIRIEFIGIRPGEKLYEEPLTQIEGTTATRHQGIFLAKMEEVDKENLAQGIEELERLAWNRDVQAIKEKLKELVPSYQPDGHQC
ncbi:MAG TPA: nucleoside-diphosphate sugar epimerase/dehydratase [Dehalococcoidia bacterium]|nr:nucleoside-diphosphate sugar epimerase/dehydratase [Dehalococcoidia bacterium]